LDAQRAALLQAQQAPLAQYSAMMPFVTLAAQQTGPSSVGTTFGIPPNPLQAAIGTATGALGAFGNYQNQQQALAQNQQFLNQQAQQINQQGQAAPAPQATAPPTSQVDYLTSLMTSGFQVYPPAGQQGQLPNFSSYPVPSQQTPNFAPYLPGSTGVPAGQPPAFSTPGYVGP
jgi:septum formation inhibitor MinC